MSTLLQILQQHPMLLKGVGVWLGLSLLINALLAIRGPEAWVALAKKNPKLALVVNVLFRAFGIDLVSVILHVRDYVNSRAAVTPGPEAEVPSPEPPKPSEETKP